MDQTKHQDRWDRRMDNKRDFYVALIYFIYIQEYNDYVWDFNYYHKHD